MADSAPTKIVDRATGREFEEKVYGEGALRFLYGGAVGRLVAGLFLKRRIVNWMLGQYWSSPLSLDRVKRFIRDFELDLSDFEVEEWNSFNHFFARRFKDGARTFCDTPWEFPAFAEGRFLAFDKVDATTSYPVKGIYLRPKEILGRGDQAEAFIGGPLMIARLCPTDYHRYHYPDSGRHIGMFDIPGSLHSVNPIALATKNDIFGTNHRRVSYLTTTNFGRLAFVEVGAMGVGRIVQTHDEDENFRRGDEKGHFAFGGSTILVFGQPGYWKPDQDILDRTLEGRETFVKLGDRVAASIRRTSERGKVVSTGSGETYTVTRG